MLVTIYEGCSKFSNFDNIDGFPNKCSRLLWIRWGERGAVGFSADQPWGRWRCDIPRSNSMLEIETDSHMGHIPRFLNATCCCYWLYSLATNLAFTRPKVCKLMTPPYDSFRSLWWCWNSTTVSLENSPRGFAGELHRSRRGGGSEQRLFWDLVVKPVGWCFIGLYTLLAPQLRGFTHRYNYLLYIYIILYHGVNDIIMTYITYIKYDIIIYHLSLLFHLITSEYPNLSQQRTGSRAPGFRESGELSAATRWEAPARGALECRSHVSWKWWQQNYDFLGLGLR